VQTVTCQDAREKSGDSTEFLAGTLADVAELTTADRAKALREAIGLTQEKLAERSEGCLTRVEVNQIEAGRNKLTSWAARDGLARAADVPIEALSAYVDGEIDLTALLLLRGSRGAARWWRTLIGSTALPPEGAEKMGKTGEKCVAVDT
jgi:transcriptional regulator with XRE-family HTH domain